MWWCLRTASPITSGADAISFHLDYMLSLEACTLSHGLLPRWISFCSEAKGIAIRVHLFVRSVSITATNLVWMLSTVDHIERTSSSRKNQPQMDANQCHEIKNRRWWRAYPNRFAFIRVHLRQKNSPPGFREGGWTVMRAAFLCVLCVSVVHQPPATGYQLPAIGR